jgi:AraC family transcriptional regulator
MTVAPMAATGPGMGAGDERQYAPIAQCRDSRAASIGDLVVTECRAAAGARLSWHAHEHACVVLLVNGSFTELFGARSVSYNTPVALYKPAGERHANEYGRTGAQFMVIELPPSQLDQLRHRGAVLDGIRSVQEPAVVDLGARIYRELHHLDAYSMLSVGGLVHELLAVLCRGDDRARSSTAPYWLRRVRDDVRENFSRRISITDLADRARVHPDHLSRSFRRHYGVLIGEYARHLRLDWAAKQLVATDVPLTELAMAAGFVDQSEFTRRFREHFGTTPGRYRIALRQ